MKEPPNMRVMAHYRWEDGSDLDIRVVGYVDTRTALAMARNLLDLKERELNGEFLKSDPAQP